jgi:antitoxin (DNA-binding transcriptional repressor) of toxin-antitoxin stability system
MAARKTVGIKDLKNNLSAYLREVRKGTRVFVSDRGTVVAEIREPGAVHATEDEPNPVLAAWVREGIVTLPTRPKTRIQRSPVRLPKGTGARLLEEVRRDRGR